MVPVVAEPAMITQRDWRGRLGMLLGLKIFVDVSAGRGDAAWEGKMDALEGEIRKAIAAAAGGGVGP